MKALVLDFDGVVSDSARECFLVARRAYLDLLPGSALADAEEEPLFATFRELMPLGNRAEDYGTALAAAESGVVLPDQAAYDAFRSGRDAAWLERYHARFYEVREALREEDPERWLGLMRPYGPFLELLRRRAGEVDYAIATSKDRGSVSALLLAYGIADLFPEDRVLDKEAGPRKSVHLERLRRDLGRKADELTFLDDKVNHLDTVAPLGVRCALAAWGYNGPREHELARERGYLVCTLEEADAQLFG
jgi:phosphoglycolate phosphatase-like HAD superfamily hydrolase